MLRGFAKAPPFDVVADLERATTLGYDRTTAYLIDKQGIVREVFPMLIHSRPDWDAIRAEARKLSAPPKQEG